MRVVASIDYVDIDGEYRSVEGVAATCSRCGACTESYGTSDASVRRCLVLLREGCPYGERNFYAAGVAPRESAADAAYRRGYAAGVASARGAGGFTAEQLRALVTLCHPDRHPPERSRLANAATAVLLGMLSEERDAA